MNRFISFNDISERIYATRGGDVSDYSSRSLIYSTLVLFPRFSKPANMLSR